MRYEFDLARSFMKSTRTGKHYHPHIWLSILGIAVGVSFLIFALSIYDGYVKKIETIIFSFYPQITLQSERVDEYLYDIDDELLLMEEKKDARCKDICKGQVILADKTLNEEENSSTQKFDLHQYRRLKKQLQTIKEIKQLSPIIFEEANFIYTYIRGQNQISAEGPLRVVGVQGVNGKFVPEIQRTITDNSVLKAIEKSNSNNILISSELYKTLFGNLPLALGDPLKICLRLKSEKDQEKTSVELNVIGTFKLGMHKISENMIVTSLKTAQKIFAMEQQATFLGISLKDPYQAERIVDDIKERTAEDNVQVFHWMAVAADMFNSLSFYRKIVIVVLLMSILITSFNIYTTLNIMVLERKKQIGVLMSMGIKKSSLYRTFFIISQIEAVIGIVIGTAAGVFLEYYFRDYFKRSLEAFLQIREVGTVFHYGTVVFILGFVCLVCGLTSAAATRKGANLDPVEALRNE